MGTCQVTPSSPGDPGIADGGLESLKVLQAVKAAGITSRVGYDRFLMRNTN